MTTLTSPPPTTPTNLIGPGRFVLIVGPSGAGKDTLIAGARAVCADAANVAFPRRVVTRATSDAEDHDSLEVADFDRAVKDGKFALWWEAHGHKYGIPSSVDGAIRTGSVVVTNVSRAIVSAVRRRYAHVETVLVTAPSDVLTSRLTRRLRQTDGSLTERVKRNDLFVGFRADHVIETTGTPDVALRLLLEVIHRRDQRVHVRIIR
jgi:ribose 1,5-bisphosphokinase